MAEQNEMESTEQSHNASSITSGNGKGKIPKPNSACISREVVLCLVGILAGLLGGLAISLFFYWLSSCDAREAAVIKDLQDQKRFLELKIDGLNHSILERDEKISDLRSKLEECKDEQRRQRNDYAKKPPVPPAVDGTKPDSLPPTTDGKLAVTKPQTPGVPYQNTAVLIEEPTQGQIVSGDFNYKLQLKNKLSDRYYYVSIKSGGRYWPKAMLGSPNKDGFYTGIVHEAGYKGAKGFAVIQVRLDMHSQIQSWLKREGANENFPGLFDGIVELSDLSIVLK